MGKAYELVVPPPVHGKPVNHVFQLLELAGESVSKCGIAMRIVTHQLKIRSHDFRPLLKTPA